MQTIHFYYIQGCLKNYYHYKIDKIKEQLALVKHSKWHYKILSWFPEHPDTNLDSGCSSSNPFPAFSVTSSNYPLAWPSKIYVDKTVTRNALSNSTQAKTQQWCETFGWVEKRRKEIIKRQCCPPASPFYAATATFSSFFSSFLLAVFLVFSGTVFSGFSIPCISVILSFVNS